MYEEIRGIEGYQNSYGHHPPNFWESIVSLGTVVEVAPNAEKQLVMW